MRHTKVQIGLGIGLATLLFGAPAAAQGQGATVVEASGGGMTVNGTERPDTILVGEDPAGPGKIVVTSPSGALTAGGTCTLGTNPVRGNAEVVCTLDEAPGTPRVVVASHGGDDRVRVGTLDGAGGIGESLGFTRLALALGGPGDDNLFVAGERSEAIGSDGDDVLRGGSGDTELIGASGNDRLFDFAGGNDTLHGGDGGDVLEAGRGRDLLTGWVGRDVLRGGRGGDRLYSRDYSRAPKRDKRLDCGPGAPDLVLLDRDPRPTGCERVKRTGRDLATGEVIRFP